MKHLESVTGSGLLKEVKESDISRVYEQIRITSREYKRNETIFLEGDIIDKICIVEKGSVRSEKIYPDGELHIVDLFDANSVFALAVAASKTRVAALDYVSNEDTKVVFLSMKSVEKSDFAREIGQSITYMLADENIRMSHKVEILAEKGLRERIMIYLGILRGKSGTDTVAVKMNREQLAQFLCVNRSALSNELSKMKKEGVIDFKGSKFIIK